MGNLKWIPSVFQINCSWQVTKNNSIFSSYQVSSSHMIQSPPLSLALQRSCRWHQRTAVLVCKCTVFIWCLNRPRLNIFSILILFLSKKILPTATFIIKKCQCISRHCQFHEIIRIGLDSSLENEISLRNANNRLWSFEVTAADNIFIFNMFRCVELSCIISLVLYQDRCRVIWDT